MKKHCIILLFLCCLYSAKAQWNNDTLVRNVICNRTNTQYQPRICTDGNNGAIICWTDLSFSPSRVCAQRIDSAGILKWATNGIVVNDTVGSGLSATDPAITTDGAGGAIIVYAQGQNGGLTNLYAVRLNASGQRVWAQAISIDAGNDARDPEIANDNSSGAIINWHRYNSGVTVHDYVQWIDSAGNLRMVANGLQVSQGNTAHYDHHAIFGGGIYGYITYHDDDTLRLQCFDTSGVFLWTNPLVLSTRFYTSVAYYDIVRANSTNVIVAWDDNRPSTQPGIYAQKVNKTGGVLWAAGGVPVDTANYGHINLQMCQDAAGGAFITYGNNYNYTQRIRTNGQNAFANPVAECMMPTGQNIPHIAADGYGGAIYCWQDGRGSTGVYAQRIDSTGNLLWRTCGSPVYNQTNGGTGNDVHLAPRNNGTGIAAFVTSSGSSQDIVAAKIENLVFTGVTSINGSGNSKPLLYPNPSHDNIIVNLNKPTNEKTRAEIVSLNGALIKSFIVNESVVEFKIDINDLPDGIYFLKLFNSNETDVLKLVKM